jgi:hypothetical protein
VPHSEHKTLAGIKGWLINCCRSGSGKNVLPPMDTDSLQSIGNLMPASSLQGQGQGKGAMQSRRRMSGDRQATLAMCSGSGLGSTKIVVAPTKAPNSLKQQLPIFSGNILASVSNRNASMGMNTCGGIRPPSLIPRGISSGAHVSTTASALSSSSVHILPISSPHASSTQGRQSSSRSSVQIESSKGASRIPRFSRINTSTDQGG